MKTIENEIGEYAGKVWHALEDQGPLPLTKLTRTTKLTNDQLHEAIGWLAREDKIQKDDATTGSVYKLGYPTNLTGKIGMDAGKVWKSLVTFRDSNATEITRFTRLTPEDVYLALGWLARENKVRANHENHETKFSLIEQERQILV